MGRARRISRFVAIALVALLAAFTYPGAVIVSMVVRLTPAPAVSSSAPRGVLPWLHVEHSQNNAPFIADESNRIVLLHGAIPAGLLDFWTGTDRSQADSPPFYPLDPAAYADQCPDNSTSSSNRYPPLCQSDLAQMASLGFNSMRLPLSWSLLEPRRGHFSQAYIDRVTQVVDWARALGMYVIIDMHQNAYSRYVGPGKGVDLAYQTGAPAWATLTDGVQSQVFVEGQREANLAVFEAFTNFWYNRDGIQDEYIAAVAALVKRFKDDSTVAGFSIFNEPQLGWNLPPGFEDLLLFPFYRRVIDAVTGDHDGLPCPTGIFMPAICGYADLGVHDLRHLFFLEPGLLRGITDFPTHLGLPVSSYPNLVFGLHTYTHGFTAERLFLKQDPYRATYPWGGFDQTYALGEREAKAMNAALFVSEFGDDPQYDPFLIANELLEQDNHAVGFAFWTWKENGGAHNWGVFDPPKNGSGPVPSSGCIRPGRERLLERVYPRASADPGLSFRYDPDSGAFSLHATGRSGDPATIVFVPPSVSGDVSTSGAATQSVIVTADGSRLVTALPTGGSFAVSVSSAQVTLTGCP